MHKQVTMATEFALKDHFRADGWRLTCELAAIAGKLAEQTHAKLTTPGHTHRPSIKSQAVSEWAAGIVARPYRERCVFPSPDDLVNAATEFLETHTGPAALARAATQFTDLELTDSYRKVYEDLWSKVGEASLRELSPALLGLGQFDHPPWDAPEANWRSGTDRSVLSRYRRYFRNAPANLAAVAEAAGLSVSQHISARLIGANPDLLVRQELGRACAPIGLIYPGHRVLVTSVVDGTRYADLLGRYQARTDGTKAVKQKSTQPGLANWAAADRELSETEDRTLTEAISAYAEQWVRWNDTAMLFVKGLSGPARPARPARRRRAAPGAQDDEDVQIDEQTLVDEQVLVDEGIQVDWLVRQVMLGVPRRIWYFAHGREVHWERPFTRDELPLLLMGIFQQHLLELIKRPIAEPPVDEPDDLNEEDRVDATRRAIAGHDQAVWEQTLALPPEDRDERLLVIYLDAVTGGAPFTAEHGRTFLTPEQFSAWATSMFWFGDDSGDR